MLPEGYRHTAETRAKISKALTGIKRSQETINRISENSKRHRHTEETKEKISKAGIGRKMTIRTREALLQRNIGNTYCLGRKPTKEEIKKKRDSMIRYVQTHTGKFRDTSPEKKMKQILSDLNIPYIHQHHVADIEHDYVADFYLPDENAVIEVDGKYWHSYPKGKDLDHIRTKEMRDSGYKVFRFWEDEVSEQEVLQKLDRYALDLGVA